MLLLIAIWTLTFPTAVSDYLKMYNRHALYMWWSPGTAILHDRHVRSFSAPRSHRAAQFQVHSLCYGKISAACNIAKNSIFNSIGNIGSDKIYLASSLHSPNTECHLMICVPLSQHSLSFGEKKKKSCSKSQAKQDTKIKTKMYTYLRRVSRSLSSWLCCNVNASWVLAFT